MSCADFERWLDEGEAEEGADVAHAHSATCPRCAASWRAAQALERSLAAVPAWAPATFTDRVMARIGNGRALAPMVAPALPWWIRAAMEPATVLALAAAGAIAWGWDGLWAVASAVRAALAHAALTLPADANVSGAGWLALQVALGSLFALSAHALYRAVDRLATRGPLTRP